MGVIELELRLHELVYPATQGYVWIAKQIGIDRVHHASDLETLAFELLISSDCIAVIRLSQLLSADCKEWLSRGFYLRRLTLFA